MSGTRAVDDRLAAAFAWAAGQGVQLDADQQERLSAYLDTLLSWNRRIDLVSQPDAESIAVKHFADCLAAAPLCPPRARIADLGSGAGFPGLVLAIALPEASVWSIESRAKRASFLAEAIRIARIRNAVAVHARVESLHRDPKHAGAYDVVTARALGSTEAFLSLAQPLLGPNGVALAMKGPRPERVDPDGFSLVFSHEYELPDGARRTLVGLRCARSPSRTGAEGGVSRENQR